MLKIFLAEAVIVAIYMTCWFAVAVKKGRNDLADIAWGLGFILVALSSLALHGAVAPRAALVTGLVVIWGTRLAVHIGLRNRGKPEDARYRKWREEWGEHVLLRSFLQIFLLQGFLLLIISVPVILVNLSPPIPLNRLDVLGFLVWLTGFLFEAVGDFQLVLFKRNPAHKGKIITSGLWRYTRHPNYFGEVTLWWGIYLIALSVPFGWLAVVGPITISFLILKVSGIPMLEKKYEGNAEFQEYKRRTSAFWPLPPRR
jgi:steroid 5-alpha reductase family enzyme